MRLIFSSKPFKKRNKIEINQFLYSNSDIKEHISKEIEWFFLFKTKWILKIWLFLTKKHMIKHKNPELNKIYYKKKFSYSKKSLKEEKGNGLLDPVYFCRIFFKSLKTQENWRLSCKESINQKDISKKMRTVLIDWLIDVHNRFKLFPRTLYLTINILDRFLSIKNISRQKLQLLGITSMLLASKYEEIYAPETRDFVYITDSAYTKEDIFRMETLICNSLKFKFSSPNPQVFFSFYFKKVEASLECLLLSFYIFELTLLEPKISNIELSSLVFEIVIISYMFVEGGKDKKILREVSEVIRKSSKKVLETTLAFSLVKALVILGQNDRTKISSIRRKFLSKKYRELTKSVFNLRF